MILYASDEGEEFMESVFYGGGIENHENRKNRLPRLLFNKMILSSYDKNISESTAGQVNLIIYESNTMIIP